MSKIWIMLSVIFLSSQTYSQEAVLHISNESIDKEYCLVYNAAWTNLSNSLRDAVKYQVVNLVSSYLCNSSAIVTNVTGKALVVLRGQCDFSHKALIAQENGAAALIIASEKNMSPPGANESDYAKVKIPVTLMRYRDFVDAQQVFGKDMTASLYAPPVPVFDVSIVVMLLIAVFTVALGGFWSGAAEKDKQSEGAFPGRTEDASSSGELSLYSPLKVVIFVALMCIMLVLMYFFYRYLVYVIIAIFCLASAMALYSCLDALMNKIGCGTCSFSCLSKEISVRSLVLLAMCVSVAVVWGVFRNEDRWIWILQDLLGIAFCLNFMKTITLSNFKICVILLSLLLLYDVFFVFITPFITPNGESIMVQVALGPESAGEKLPVVMRVPRFSAWAQNLCGMQFSILGYGDIIVPGLLIAYCHRFDVWTGSSKKVYYISCTIAYFLGMIVTFAVMLLSKMGQPALLYLVPFTLITSAVVAWSRNEIRQFWAGTTYQVLDSSREPLSPDGEPGYASGDRKC